MTKHTVVVEFESTPKLLVSATDVVAQRVWVAEGIVMNTVVARELGKDVIVISRFEHDAMLARINHLESTLEEGKTKITIVLPERAQDVGDQGPSGEVRG